MHNLFGDRFLKLFAGDLQRRLKQTISIATDQNPEALAEGAVEPVASAHEEKPEKILTEGNHLLSAEEQIQKNKSERLSD